MVDKKQIEKWLKEGTITQEQAKKMLSDSTQKSSEEKSNKFISIVAIIGAILIFIGFAWLVARNWHQMPDVIKVLILVTATLGAFIFGVIIRQYNHEGVGRALITLGALLFILSVFLIAQIYAIPTGLQGYAWLLLLCWPTVLLIAYFLNSPENLVVSMISFFSWVILQYFASITESNLSSVGGPVFSFILIFLSAGALLFGLSVLHNSLAHRFTNIYRFWTMFYFLAIFYLLSFQFLLPILAEYSFEGEAFSVFFVAFVVTCFFGFFIGAIFAVRKSSASFREILTFIVVLVVLFILILSTKAGAGQLGNCYAKNCYDLKTSAECSLAPYPLVCEWKFDAQFTKGSCDSLSCYNYNTEKECSSSSDRLDCTWQINNWSKKGFCQQQIDITTPYETCRKNNNQKDLCVENSLCRWQPSYGFWSLSGKIPTSLWLLWIVNNFVFIGFIVLVLWYGQKVGSTKIVNLALIAFLLEVLSRYIGFWANLRGYLSFSILAIFGGLILIIGAWQLPKLKRKILEKAKQAEGFN